MSIDSPCELTYYLVLKFIDEHLSPRVFAGKYAIYAQCDADDNKYIFEGNFNVNSPRYIDLFEITSDYNLSLHLSIVVGTREIIISRIRQPIDSAIIRNKINSMHDCGELILKRDDLMIEWGIMPKGTNVLDYSIKLIKKENRWFISNVMMIVSKSVGDTMCELVMQLLHKFDPAAA